MVEFNKSSKKAINYLKKDSVLQDLIKRYPEPKIGSEQNLFTGVVEAIISQQLSEKAAGKIIDRFYTLFEKRKDLSPLDVLGLEDLLLRQSGLSRQKTEYIKGFAHLIQKKTLNLDDLIGLPDNELIEELTRVKGIGRWTAEMVLIFSLNRPDVFSVGDLGLRTAVSRLYNVDRENLSEIEKISLRWKPYRTHASLYLWMSLE